MKVKYNLILIGVLSFIFLNCSKKELTVIKDEPVIEYEAKDVTKSFSKPLYMHYMPWFETKESSENNKWGIHWTMANKNPDQTDSEGRREIASHFHPLIGPYHSGDEYVVEYHLLLMKYAGIDGVLIDWYGTFDANDYAINLANSETIISMLEKVGLKFAIVYEDQTLQAVVDDGLAASVENAAKTDMNYLQKNYFNQSTYLEVNSQPLLLTFGPQELQTAEEWSDAFSGLSPKPALLTLQDHSYLVGDNAKGEFAWLFNGNESAEDEFYTNKIQNMQISMGSAYPGFDDYYKEGGWGSNIGFEIAHDNGVTLTQKLQKVKNTAVDFIQLVTWNDFGEGTIIEPTAEFEFDYLKRIQQFADVSESSNVFANIYRLYQLRVAHKGESKVQKKLDQAFYYFVSLQTEKATEMLDEAEE